MTFKSVLRFYKFIKLGEFEIACDELGIDIENTTEEQFKMLIEILNTQRWVGKEVVIPKGVSEEEYKEFKEYNKTFDFEKDADAIIYDFKRYLDIDLWENDMCYFKFMTLLNGIFMEEHGKVAHRIKARNYKKQKGESSEYVTYMNEQKELYRLSGESYEEINMYDTLKSQIGGENGK